MPTPSEIAEQLLLSFGSYPLATKYAAEIANVCGPLAGDYARALSLLYQMWSNYANEVRDATENPREYA
jgi:hypothetical protein